jgi:hypothetical protein
MPQLEHFRIKVFRAVAEHLSFRKGGQIRQEALANSNPTHFRPQAVQSTPLKLSLDKQEQMQYSLVKVFSDSVPGSTLLPSAARTASRKRSIFYSFVFSIFRIPIFTTPLFSHLSALPYSFFRNTQIPQPQSPLCGVFSLNSFVVSSLPPLCLLSTRFFAHASFVFSRLQPLSQEHPGGVPGCNRGTLGNVQ